MRLFFLLAFGLSACATNVDHEGSKVRTTRLVCGSTIRLDISHDGRTAVMRSNEGREAILQRTSSSMGIRYEGQGLALLRSGDVFIFVRQDGTTLNCDPLQR
jgi:hypothetical protein